MSDTDAGGAQTTAREISFMDFVQNIVDKAANTQPAEQRSVELKRIEILTMALCADRICSQLDVIGKALDTQNTLAVMRMQKEDDAT